MEDDVKDLTASGTDESQEQGPNIPCLPAPFNSKEYELLAFDVCHDIQDTDESGESNLLKWSLIAQAHDNRVTLLTPFNPGDEIYHKSPIGARYAAALTYLRTRFFDQAINKGVGNFLVNHAMYVHNVALLARFRNQLYLEQLARQKPDTLY